MIKDRRLGRFYISMELISYYPEKVIALMSGMIILHAEYEWGRQAIYYTAVSPRFDEVPDGCAPRDYYLKQTENGLELSRE